MPLHVHYLFIFIIHSFHSFVVTEYINIILNFNIVELSQAWRIRCHCKSDELEDSYVVYSSHRSKISYGYLWIGWQVALLAGNWESSMEPIKKSKATSVKSICVGEDKKLRPKVIVNFRLSVPIIPFKNEFCWCNAFKDLILYLATIQRGNLRLRNTL